jgi:molybdate transport system substrate-binding protein
MAEIKVFSAGGVEGPLEGLIHEFQRETGHKVQVAFNTVGAIQSKLRAGEKPDLAVLSAPAVEALAKEGLVDAASRTEFASTVARSSAPQTPGHNLPGADRLRLRTRRRHQSDQGREVIRI